MKDQSNKSTDFLLEMQLSQILTDDTPRLVVKEDVLTFNLNSMLFAANDILVELHSERFNNEITDFEWISDEIVSLVNLLFNILNQLEVDTPDYQEILSYKETLPMIIRTDKILGVTSMITFICELSEVIWSRLDSGLTTIGQAELMNKSNNVTEDDLDIEDEIVGAACHILAVLDTLCHHYLLDLRTVLTE